MVLINTLFEQFKATSFMEWLAFLFGVAQVILAWKNNVSNFYFGAFSVMLYVYLFYQNGLFAEALLNVYYLVVSVGGIFMWRKNVSHIEPIIRVCDKKFQLQSLLLFLLTFLILFIVLKQFTKSTVPLADALVSALAWTGAYLLIHRKLENWLWLTASNILAIPLQWYKGMPLTALLTLIYLIVGIIGYFDWKRTLRLNHRD